MADQSAFSDYITELASPRQKGTYAASPNVWTSNQTSGGVNMFYSGNAHPATYASASSVLSAK